MTESDKTALDWIAGGVTAATVFGWLPSIVAVLTLVYMVIRIFETQTVRRLIRAVCARCAAWWEAK